MRQPVSNPRAVEGGRDGILLQVSHASKTFDVSPPWLTRTLGRQPRQLLRAVDDVTFDIRRG